MQFSTRRADRPESEVSDVTGLIGAVALGAMLALAVVLDLTPLAAMPLFLIGTALPMVIWLLLTEKVHHSPTTGLDFSFHRPLPEVLDVTRTKLIGLGATFGLIACAYFSFRTYLAPAYGLYFALTTLAVPIIALVSPLYIGLTTRHMIEPRDGLWHFGKLVSLSFAVVDYDKIKDHVLAWTVKAFFLAFMASVFPGTVASILHAAATVTLTDPLRVIVFLVQVAFLFDACFGTLGYILTFRVLDSHIRSANPYLSGWVAALACYPPFVLMGTGGPLDYRSGTQEWSAWFDGQPTLLLIWGGAMLVLALIYAWATVVFGIRFSNLTHRGIITTGPYRVVRHPAYLSKNVMWWMVHLPFLSTASSSEAIRNCILLLVVNAIYFARAKTEEKHLLADPRYQAYSEWIAENGLFARLFHGRSRLRGHAGVSAIPSSGR